MRFPRLIAKICVPLLCLSVLGCAADRIIAGFCEENVYLECEDGVCTPVETCAGETPLCYSEFGCVACVPGSTTCVQNDVYTCNADGQPGEYSQSCQTCAAGACLSECDLAALHDSYLGCEFVAVTTSNPDLDVAFDRDFAIAVGNPDKTRPVRVQVTRGDDLVASRVIDPGGTETFRLAMLTEITRAETSQTYPDGAYMVRSELPVMAYQFNPLHFYMRSVVYIHSFTNDASLLLPVHAFDREYRISTKPTFGVRYPSGSVFNWAPGFAAVVATEDDTQVTISLAKPQAADSGLPFDENNTSKVTLHRGDVLQLLSDHPPSDEDGQVCANNDWPQELALGSPLVIACAAEPYDLSGSTISSNKPIGVFGGHACTFVPLGARACDHLEEMLLPISRWGDATVMTAPAHPDGLEHGTVEAEYTVLAHHDGTSVTFTPEVHPPVILDAGESTTFLSDVDFQIQSNKQFQATQTLLGQVYLDSEAGDPAVGIGVPIFQTRDSYTFLTPSTFTRHFVNIVTDSEFPITLDGVTIEDWSPIAGTDYSVARLPLQAGPHLAQSAVEEGFTIVVYGYAETTSYLYPGGLNLKSFLE